jgi:hypothetical protein
MRNVIKTIVTLGISLSVAAFSPPRQGEIVELESFLNARSEAKFRTHDQNVLLTLPPKTRGQITNVKHFPDSGNYGLELTTVDPRTGKSITGVWVYYNIKNPNLKLLRSMNSDETTSSPAAASAAETVQATTAVRAPGSKNDTQSTAASAIQSLTAMNQIQTLIQPEADCKNCKAQSPVYEKCGVKNSYFETQLDILQSVPGYDDLVSSRPRYPRIESCVRESMNMSGGKFRVCDQNGNQVQTRAPKACASDRLVNVTQNAFGLSVDCLAEFLNKDAHHPAVLKETFRNTIALVNLESGFQINSHSNTSAAGLGQITDGTTDWINKTMWNKMKAHIANSQNPSCSDLRRFDLKPSRPSRAYVCDRLGLQNGNPITNMLYTLGHLKLVRQEIESVFDRRMKELRLKITPEFREKLIGNLTNWGHNTGAYGITRPLLSGLETVEIQNALKAQNADKFNELMKFEVASFHEYYLKRRNFPEDKIPARVIEASRFNDYVQNKLKTLEKRVGRECSI